MWVILSEVEVLLCESTPSRVKPKQNACHSAKRSINDYGYHISLNNCFLCTIK